MLFKLLLPPQTNDEPSNAPVIIISKDLWGFLYPSK
jgi:hypothetical protein